MQHCVIVQEGFGVNAEAVYYCNEAPVYETERIPVMLTARVPVIDAPDGEARMQVDERDETFVYFTPVNGPNRRRGKLNKVPFTRLVAVVPIEA